jgi:hypothetical protein
MRIGCLSDFRHHRIAAIAGPEDYLCSRESTGLVPGTAR